METRYARVKRRYIGFVGNKCSNCAKEYFPPVHRCKKCGSIALQDKPMPRVGRLVTHTELSKPLPGFESRAPLTLAILELSNGVRVLGEVVSPPNKGVRSGAKAKAVTRQIRRDPASGEKLYGYKFLLL
jgi:uncharacterized OB-fold protein